MKKYFLLIIILIALTIMTGCWDRRELNDLAIASALGIDKINNQYSISLQIVNPGEVASSKSGNSSRAPITTYHAEGDTVNSALRKISKTIPRTAYLSHIRVIILSEDLAVNGISQALELISRSHEFRSDFYILIAKETSARSIMDILVPMEKIPAAYIFSSLTLSEKRWGETSHITIDKLVSDMISKGKSPTLPGISVITSTNGNKKSEDNKEANPNSYYKISQMAAFKEDRLVGWLNEKESIGYNYIQEKTTDTVIDISNSSGAKLSIELFSIKCKIKTLIDSNKIVLSIQVSAEGDIDEMPDMNIDITKGEAIDKIQHTAEKKVAEEIDSALLKAQRELKTDIFGFGDALHRSDPKIWKTVQKDWDNLFSQAQPDIAVDIKIRRSGTVNNSFLKSMKGE